MSRWLAAGYNFQGPIENVQTQFLLRSTEYVPAGSRVSRLPASAPGRILDSEWPGLSHVGFWARRAPLCWGGPAGLDTSANWSLEKPDHQCCVPWPNAATTLYPRAIYRQLFWTSSFPFQRVPFPSPPPKADCQHRILLRRALSSLGRFFSFFLNDFLDEIILNDLRPS